MNRKKIKLVVTNVCIILSCLFVNLMIVAQTPYAGIPQTNSGGRVTCITQDGTYTYVGGNFTSLGGAALTNLARFNTSTGAVDAGWALNSPKPIQKIIIDGSSIYVVGSFKTTNGPIGGQLRNRLAKLNNTDGSADATWNPNPNGAVNSYAMDASGFYVGGTFTSRLSL